MRIILLDGRANFRNDVRNRLLIDDDRNVELLTDMGDANSIDVAVSRYKPDAVIVADNIYILQSAWTNLSTQVVGYITKSGNDDVFAPDGIPSFGLIQSASHLLNLLETGIPAVKLVASPAAQIEQKNAPVHSSTEIPPEPRREPHEAPKIYKEQSPVSFNRPVDDEEDDQAFQKLYYGSKQNQRSMPSFEGNGVSSKLDSNGHTEGSTQNSAGGYRQTSYTDGAPRADAGVYVKPAQSVKERMDEERNRRKTEDTSSRVMADLASKQTQTKTVAVYAAKGGVGKTTIATELAVYLSLISQGRGRLKVCLIDYNIDFGDVLTTLNLDKNGPNLTHWARDVRRRKMMGENTEDIQYSLQEIEGRLQRYNNSSLHVLVAPIVHEDSMEVESDELEIILKNIIQNGQFDFVICDTGNNTRDSTVIALDTADTVLLIATQDVSAVNCDRSFLGTMSRVGFDTSKIRLVINSIMPYKYTQVEVREVEEMFPYPCIARIKRDPEVTKANNCSSPIVHQPNHEFTKEMRRICAHLTGQEIPEETKKFNLLSLFKKKG